MLYFVKIFLLGKNKISGIVEAEDRDEIIQCDSNGIIRVNFLNGKSLDFSIAQLQLAEIESHKKSIMQKPNKPLDKRTLKKPKSSLPDEPPKKDELSKKRGRPKGFKVSEETRQKLRNAHKRRTQK